MTGHLVGDVSGSPVDITANGNELLITFKDWATAWKLRATANPTTPLIDLIRAAGIGLSIQTRHGGRRIELVPHTSFIVRLLVPELR